MKTLDEMIAEQAEIPERLREWPGFNEDFKIKTRKEWVGAFNYYEDVDVIHDYGAGSYCEMQLELPFEYEVHHDDELVDIANLETMRLYAAYVQLKEKSKDWFDYHLYKVVFCGVEGIVGKDNKEGYDEYMKAQA